MVNFLIAVASMAFVLGIMIVIHELGHHLVAKFFGVRVETFSVGFGKRLLGFKLGGTDYRLSALPLGGYVKMAGENPMEQRTGDPGEFMSHPRWQRILIALAGPAMNIILAIGLLTAVFMIKYDHLVWLDKPAKISFVDKDSAAERAGIQPGDLITRVNNTQNPTWEDVTIQTMLSTREPVSLAIDRNGKTLTLSLRPEPAGPNELGTTGLGPQQPILVTTLEPDMPLAKAGVKLGDEITALNGKHFDAVPPIQDFLAQNNGAPVELTINRAGSEFKTTVTPVISENGGTKRFRLGFASMPVEHQKLPFAQAFNRSLEQNKKFAFLLVELVQKMAERKVSMKQIDGPIGIARVAGEAAREEGWTPLMNLMAAISLNLGIFNLMPIPILDGGLILLTLIESVIRRDIDQRIKERIYQTAFVFLVLFAVAVVYNDVTKLPVFSKYLP
jgi:regulator of sigma E protease